MSKYTLREKIDSGGFGEVYRAQNDETGQMVAYKVLAGHLGVDEIQRFAREVKIQSQLDHVNIMPVIASNLTHSPPFFYMPLARCSLRAEIAQKSFPNNPKRALDVFRQILEGIKYAHKNGVIHRDLKPENVLLFDDIFEEDWVRIGDFGLGKRLTSDSIALTQKYIGMGSAPYMPPEQFDDFKSCDERADIFALGKVLYEMLTGRSPTTIDLKDKHLGSGYRFLVEKCTAAAKEERYSSVQELIDEVDLLTKGSEKFVAPVEKFSAICNSCNCGDLAPKKAVADLDALLASNREDEAFFLQVFPELHGVALQEYIHAQLPKFQDKLLVYDAFVSGHLSFSYTDKVADLYRRIIQLTDSTEIQKIVYTRLLVMGFSHNRFHVRDVLTGLLDSVKDPKVALLIKDICKRHPSETAWVGEVFKGTNTIQLIRDIFSPTA